MHDGQITTELTTPASYWAAIVAFFASIEVSVWLSFGTFVLAIATFLVNKHYRKKELELSREEFKLKQRRLEHDIERSKGKAS